MQSFPSSAPLISLERRDKVCRLVSRYIEQAGKR